MSSPADTNLPEKVERLLADMPPGDRDWEALAVRTIEQAMLAKDTPASLLEPPLPPEEGEAGFERKEPAVAKAAAVSLADLARASVKKKNDGAKDIALESLAVASQARAQVEEIAERVQAATKKTRASTPDIEPAAAPAPPVVESAASSEPPAPAVPAAAPVPATAPQAAPTRGPWIVAGFAVLAAAAAIAISQRPKTEPAPLVVSQVQEGAAKSAAKAPTLADPNPAAPTAAPAEAQAQPLPVAEAAPSPGHPVAMAPKGPAAPPVPSGVAPDKIELEDEEPASPPPVAAAPPSAKMVPAELPRGGLPDKPSAGAAYAAIGPYMGSARACVAGHDDPSTARIVFSSDGSVQSVSVSGPAGGTPAAACIASALKKARVQPFAAPTFTMSAPIRPQ